jgi:hypothetical protein
MAIPNTYNKKELHHPLQRKHASNLKIPSISLPSNSPNGSPPWTNSPTALGDHKALSVLQFGTRVPFLHVPVVCNCNRQHLNQTTTCSSYFIEQKQHLPLFVFLPPKWRFNNIPRNPNLKIGNVRSSATLLAVKEHIISIFKHIQPTIP